MALLISPSMHLHILLERIIPADFPNTTFANAMFTISTSRMEKIFAFQYIAAADHFPDQNHFSTHWASYCFRSAAGLLSIATPAQRCIY